MTILKLERRDSRMRFFKILTSYDFLSKENQLCSNHLTKGLDDEKRVLRNLNHLFGKLKFQRYAM